MTAFSAASWALLSPLPTPMPIMASPCPSMTVRTSAKSMLISPASVMRSEMPCTPCLSTSSAMRKASLSGVFLSTTLRRFWLGITMTVSAACLSFEKPSSAILFTTRPSKVKGFVTTATVSAPKSRAVCAMMGAEPVPVPPPSPAVTKTMSAPRSACSILSLSSIAAFSPISGFPPAPRPFVIFEPTPSLISALERPRSCRSVFTAINWTFLRPAMIMRFTAFEPPPPVPITFITVGLPIPLSSTSSIAIRVLLGLYQKNFSLIHFTSEKLPCLPFF